MLTTPCHHGFWHHWHMGKEMFHLMSSELIGIKRENKKAD
jgi:hypothetical protein